MISLLVATLSASNLPYNPTVFLVSPQNSSVAYIFRPASTTSQQFQLNRLDLTKTISSSNTPYDVIQAKLPFLDDSKPTPFTVAIDGNGLIIALAGNCSASQNVSRVWTLDTGGTAGRVASSWTQLSSSSNLKVIPEYLSSAITFPSSTTGATNDFKTYIFGGMCPNGNSTTNTWTSSAQYSNAISKLGLSGNQFNVASISPRNPPVAQAGQTLTPLTPMFSNRTDGTQTSQQNFILLGGHTGAAFLNLSQAALFSLPQETWTYLSISAFLGKSGGSSIQPRSGHTATLSSDGKQIVVFGGWIGDISTPATPQMVVLDVADGYGGSGNWAWSFPTPLGSAPQPSSGLYGHGTLMLPGNVMLITGGYSISPGFGTRKRDFSQQPNTKTYLYNITSSSWISDYNAPTGDTSEQKSRTSTSQKVGIGIGVTVAVIIVIGLFIFYLWHRRRMRWQLEAREDQLRGMKEGFVSDDWGTGGHDDEGRFYRHVGAAGLIQPAAYINRERELNSSKPFLSGDGSFRGPKRNSTGGRGPYAYERSRHQDSIHPIIEGNEDSPRLSQHASRPLMGHDRTKYSVKNTDDPFVDPLGSHPIDARTRSLNHEQEQEIETWSTQWARAGNDMIRDQEREAGNISPSKSERTMTSMSSVSAITTRSQLSTGHPIGLVRSFSHKSAALLNSLTNTFSAGPYALTSSSPPDVSPISVNRSIHSKKRPNKNDTTLPPDLATLQAESESLLRPPPRNPNRLKPQIHKDEPERSGTVIRKPPPQIGSWVGSVRRVIGMSSAVPNTRSTSLTAASERTRDGAVNQHQNQGMSTAMATGTSSVNAGIVVPRRSASDAAFWKGKRGAKDWGENATKEDDEWDVETAAQNRVVQLMFTVPRERLRVVNADVDGRSLNSAEEPPGKTSQEEQDITDENWQRS